TGLAGLKCFNPRDFTTDKHRTVDDKPFGGGPGMLMKTEPLQAAIGAARTSLERDGKGLKTRTIYLSPQGRPLDQTSVRELAERQQLLLVCGRYQGIDQRLLDSEVDEEWSVGDYVLSGGELAAMVLADAVIRCLPGALGDEDSVDQDSFSAGLLHCPEFTRPQMVGERQVPEILLGGNHEQIRRWRIKQSLGMTWLKRPDLLERQQLDRQQQALLQEFIKEHNSNAQSAES
ncbi:MAG: tRNA (guanosine(37)-N1)-methyltransferase TrmD, partial [Pseudohongiellaceae bacterium]